MYEVARPVLPRWKHLLLTLLKCGNDYPELPNTIVAIQSELLCQSILLRNILFFYRREKSALSNKLRLLSYRLYRVQKDEVDYAYTFYKLFLPWQKIWSKKASLRDFLVLFKNKASAATRSARLSLF